VPAKAGRLTDLELTEAAGPAAICHAPLELDLGGIAKGFAVDCAIEALREAGCGAGLVNAGGDVRVIGATRELILLRRPDGALQPHELREAALAVSDREARQAPSGHRGYYLRIAAAPAKTRYAAIRARTAMAADALTKCALLCPAALTRSLLKALEGQRVA
jgi:thiamine biosynthesis lipoprotein